MFSLIFMSILDIFLKKKGVKSANELDNSPTPDGSPTERQVFEEWKKILDKEELTLGDLKIFIQAQIGVIEAKWRDLNLEQSKKAELIPYHTVYKLLEQTISSPLAEREQLLNHLEQIIK